MTEEQPIDIHQYTRAIRHALPQILVLALIVAITATTGTILLPSKAYTASTTILARDTLASNQFPDATTVTRRLAGVNLLTRTTSVLSLAASKAPGTTVDELRSAVHSSADPEANVITVTATADTADAAAARANQVALALIATERRIEQQAATGALQAAVAQVEQLRSAGATKAEIKAADKGLASLAANAVGSASGFQVVQSAEPPRRPSSPPPWYSGIVAFLAIVVFGMLMVLAREQVGPRVSSSQDLGQVFSMPVLASIPLVRRVKPNDLPVLPQAVRDAFYVLASAVRLKANKHGTKIVFVVSAVRGEGRTTVAANLSQALSMSGASVLAVCADLRSPRLHKWLDTPQSPGLTDVLVAAGREGKVLDVAEPARTAPSVKLERGVRAAISSKNGKLHVLPSGLAADDPTPLLFGDAIPSVFNAIRALPYDFVVVDTPPGFGIPDIRALAPHADAFLVVARTHRLRMSEAVELRDLLDAFDKQKLGLAVFEREAQPISHLAPDGIDEARTGAATGEREVIELR
ncbi:MAG: tyrosine-protein kinase family protein [Gaiellaceae bacterium]